MPKAKASLTVPVTFNFWPTAGRIRDVITAISPVSSLRTKDLKTTRARTPFTAPDTVTSLPSYFRGSLTNVPDPGRKEATARRNKKTGQRN